MISSRRSNTTFFADGPFSIFSDYVDTICSDFSNLDACTINKASQTSQVDAHKNIGPTMLSTDKKECWVLAPDDREVNFDSVHYFEQYIGNGGGWHCLLCHAGPMRKNRVRHHRNGTGHSSAIKELAQERSVFEARTKTLGHELWRHCVKAAKSTPVRINASVEDRRAHYFYFLRTLETCEQMERLSLLELAIWKVSCIANGVVFSTMREIDDYWALESSFDPRVYLQQKRITSGATVIIENVLPFLQE
jgi:hypothetical protein